MDGLLNITIRQFKRADLDAVSHILLFSFKNKFHILKNLSNSSIEQMLSDSGFTENMPFEGYFVAESNNKVVGVLLLKWKNQKRLNNPGKMNFISLGSKYGYVNMLSLFFSFSILSEKVLEDECYIEHIAVSPEAQGFGAGRALLQYGQDYIEKKLDQKRYSLHVSANNKSAIHLYEKFGFSVMHVKKSILSGIIFHEKKWLYMVKGLRDQVVLDKKYTMKTDWLFGFLGIIGVVKIPVILSFFNNSGSPLVLLNIFWFLWFTLFIPEKK